MSTERAELSQDCTTARFLSSIWVDEGFEIVVPVHGSSDDTLGERDVWVGSLPCPVRNTSDFPLAIGFLEVGDQEVAISAADGENGDRRSLEQYRDADGCTCQTWFVEECSCQTF